MRTGFASFATVIGNYKHVFNSQRIPHSNLLVAMTARRVMCIQIMLTAAGWLWPTINEAAVTGVYRGTVKALMT